MTPPSHSGRIDTGQDQVRIRLDDAMLEDGVADMRWLLHDALLAGTRRVVVDLTGTRHLPSLALASLLWAHRTCRARGGAVVLRGANRGIQGVLQRTGLWRVFRLENIRERTGP